jgi:RNA polymerase sigma-70 factor, ECF subfamily
VEDLDRPTEKVQQRLDRETFERCFAQFAGGVRAVLKSKLGNEADVEDCFSRVFEKLWMQGSSVNPAALGAWLFVVARREAALQWRKQKSTDVAIDRLAEGVSEFDPLLAPIEGILLRERIDSLKSAIQELPQEQQEVLRRRFIEDQSFREIAEALNVPLGTALTRLHIALKKLRAKLSDE